MANLFKILMNPLRYLLGFSSSLTELVFLVLNGQQSQIEQLASLMKCMAGSWFLNIWGSAWRQLKIQYIFGSPPMLLTC